MKRKIYRCLQFLLSFFIAFTMPVFSMFEVHADGLDVNQSMTSLVETLEIHFIIRIRVVNILIRFEQATAVKNCIT